MVKRSFDFVLNKVSNMDKIVIVGAGEKGIELLKLLQSNNVSVESFFDNGNKDEGVEGTKVMKPQKLEGDKNLYIISVCDIQVRNKLRMQLEELGIDKSQIIIYHGTRDYEYMSDLDENYYKDELTQIYRERLGKDINWENPQTYTEKINWEKLNDRDIRKTICADKYLVRDWVKERIGEQYLVKNYGVWEKAEDINFDALPKRFVLKANHMSGANIIVTDKEKLDWDSICKQLNKWMNLNYAYSEGLELHYGGIEPRIICEEFLDGVAESIYEYDIYCFRGKPRYVQCIKASHRPEWQGGFYDLDWNWQGFAYGCPLGAGDAPKPDKLEEMLELSRSLCKDFKHVRVDWYNLPDGRVLFGELTFTSWAGIGTFTPPEWDKVFGDLIGNVMC